MYYDRKGKKISLQDWMMFLSCETADPRRVALDEFPGGSRVSTVWLGLDHSFGAGPPLIFETMVFGGEDFDDLDMERYATEEEAIEGHKAMVAKWRPRLS